MSFNELLLELNKTIYSNGVADENFNTMLGKITESFYDAVFDEQSKLNLLILIIVLLLFGLIGTIANVYVLFIFKFIFKKHFNRDIQAKLVAAALHENALKVSTHYDNHRECKRREALVKLYKSFNNMRNQLLFNSELKIFYSLIRYLAVIDLFTCSIAIPVSVYEILKRYKISEFSCKLFEFIRAFGVISSSFTIILISIERYISLYKLQTFKKYFLKFRKVFATTITIIISIVCMLPVSVYQKYNDRIVYSGVCLKSKYTLNDFGHNVVNIMITTIFISGSIIVLILYSLIFKKV